VDVLIGTPGRLIDYFKQRVYTLRHVEVLVIDEADRMFDMGFIADLRFLLRRLPPYDKRQSMLFSATLSWDVMELAYEHMNDPIPVAIEPEKITAENVEHVLYHVGRHEKLPLLLGLLQREQPERTLMFVNTKREAEWLTQRLADNGFHAGALTGDLHQRVRLRVLREFKAGTLPILVATDVASRGLHIEGVTHVVNYDVPQDAEDYVHRIGRTARPGHRAGADAGLRDLRHGAGGDRRTDRFSPAGRARRGRHAGEAGAAVARRAHASRTAAAPAQRIARW